MLWDFLLFFHGCFDFFALLLYTAPLNETWQIITSLLLAITILAIMAFVIRIRRAQTLPSESTGLPLTSADRTEGSGPLSTFRRFARPGQTRGDYVQFQNTELDMEPLTTNTEQREREREKERREDEVELKQLGESKQGHDQTRPIDVGVV